MTAVRTAGWTESIGVLDRITAVFEAIGATERGLGITELARRANLPKSTVSRLAAILVEQRLLDRDGDRLYLGVRLFEFGQTVERPRRLRALAHPVMAELRNVTGLSVNLALLEDRHVVLIAVVGGRTGMPPLAMGSRFPAHATALGKALLAFPAEDRSVRHVLDGGLLRRTPHTICDPAEFVRELREVRRSGVAFEREECLIGRACVAGAILSLGAVAVAAISVTGTPADVAQDRVAPAVRSAAKTLGHRLDLHRDL